MDIRTQNNLLRSGLGIVLGLTIGLPVGVTVEALSVRQWHDMATAQTEKVDSLTRELKLANDEVEEKQRGIEKCFIGDGTKTIIVSGFSPGAGEMMASFMQNALIARGSSYGLTMLGPALVIPRRVLPTTTDGSLGFFYAYLGADGKIEGWFQPQKGK